MSNKTINNMRRSSSLSSPPPSDLKRPRPQQPPGTNWKDGLITAMSDPEQIYEQDELTVTLKDAFPKARYHFLVVPKEPINSVKELSRSNLDLLNHIHKLAEDLIERVHKKEPNTLFRFGYHAVPSMKRLHLHIVSQDFDSPCMKKERHWNTFNTEYFMDSSVVIKTLKKEGCIEVNDKMYEELLTLSMKCNACNCSKRFNDIFALKNHLIEHYGPSRVPPSVPTPWNTSRRRRQSCIY